MICMMAITIDTPNRRTITLTDRPPVTICEDEWPEIVKWWDGDNREFRQQPNRQWIIRIRQHADGRAIVYGVYRTCWQGDRDIRAGELVPAGVDVIPAIRRVAETIFAREGCVRECIEELPAASRSSAPL